MHFGYHVSTAGGLYNAFKEAAALDCEAFQIFVGSPQAWATGTPTGETLEKFHEAKKNSKIKKILVHAAYLPNPSSHKPTLRNLSLKKLKDEAKVAYAIGADGYNFHCGSNQDSTEAGIKHVVDTLNRLAELTDEKWPVTLIIENDAGAGNRIGDTIEELAAIWKGLKNKKRFGFCLDTCHLFVSGIDLSTKKDVNDMLTKFDNQIGLSHLHFIHMNDTKFGLGSKKDRHENIGKGMLPLEGIKALITHPKLKDMTFILETPRTGDVKVDIKDIKTLRRLAGK